MHFRVERVENGAGTPVELRLSGRLALSEVGALRDALRREIARPAPAYRFDVSAVESVDAGATALLVELREEASRGRGRAEIVGAGGSVEALVRLFDERLSHRDEVPPPARIGVLDQVGRQAIAALRDVREILAFVGGAFAAFASVFRSPRSLNWGDVGRIAERAGADALPIVSLICFLVGLILAFQSAVQLRLFNAEIYVADAVALSITRELGPLMVAIIVAGRSGAAFAAELGTMRVSEEVDALRTIGLDPYRYLVFPRVLALVVMMPLLTLLGDLLGLVGGFLVGVFGLDLNAAAYLAESKSHLDLWDVASGLVKSVAFAATVALIGCERGLATTGGATGVGRSTTSAVVTSLFHIVVIDFAFTLLYQVWDL